jgi:hypothetical protein
MLCEAMQRIPGNHHFGHRCALIWPSGEGLSLSLCLSLSLSLSDTHIHAADCLYFNSCSFEFATIVRHYYGERRYKLFQIAYNLCLQASNIAAMVISALVRRA